MTPHVQKNAWSCRSEYIDVYLEHSGNTFLKIVGKVKVKVKFSRYRPEQALGNPVG
jgi:hypothetical protein